MIYEFKVRRVRRSKASENIVKVATPENIATAVRPYVLGEAREVFLTVCLDARHGILGIERTAIGSMSSVEVHPREVFRTALLVGASAIVMVHNHPSGDPAPSVNDANLTQRFVQCGDLLGIEVLDHVIVTDSGKYYSFREESRLIEDNRVVSVMEFILG